MGPLRVLISILGTVSVLGCAASTGRVGHSATVHIGVVQNAETVTLDSAAAQGALIGGLLGAVTSGRQSTAGGAVRGAAVGGVATAAAEGGQRTGMAYTVRLPDGSSTRIVTDQREIHVGDCVAVERVGTTANIRRKSPDYCEPANASAVESVHDASNSEAVACEAAKAELAKATGDEERDRALRRAELLCNG